MRTINTTLPVYNRIEKQCYERSKKAHNEKAPTVCPFHRFPSLQWDIEDDDAGYINSVKLQVEKPVDILTGWTNGPGGGAYDTFTSSGTSVTSAISDLVSFADSNDLTVEHGALYIATINLTLTVGASLDLRVGNGLTLTTGDNYVTMYSGVNIIPIRCTADSTNAFIRLYNAVGNINFSLTFSLEKEVMDKYFGERQSFINTYTNNGYDTFTTLYRTTVSVIKTTAADTDYFTFNLLSALNVSSGDIFRVPVVLRLNSGTAPKMVIVDSGGNDISNVVTLKNGLNYVIFKATGTDASSVIRVRNGAGETTDFIFVPAIYVYKITPDIENVSDEIFQYDGSVLQHLLTSGEYYLEMTSSGGYTYYSDYFNVSCVYPNLLTAFTNANYDTFTGTIEIAATSAGGTKYATINTFSVIKGEAINLLTNLVLTSGELPTVRLMTGLTIISNEVQLAAGNNEVTLTATAESDTAYIQIYNSNATSFALSEVSIIREYSEDYVTINFENSCDLGDIHYTGFDQTLWLETEAMEPTFPYREQGQENGDGVFVPTWQRQDKIYQIRTKLIPQYIVDVLHRLKLHDTVTLIDTVGDEYTVEEIDIDHEWQFDDKYYALATISADLGDGIVNSGCCT